LSQLFETTRTDACYVGILLAEARRRDRRK